MIMNRRDFQNEVAMGAFALLAAFLPLASAQAERPPIRPNPEPPCGFPVAANPESELLSSK